MRMRSQFLRCSFWGHWLVMHRMLNLVLDLRTAFQLASGSSGEAMCAACGRISHASDPAAGTFVAAVRRLMGQPGGCLAVIRSNGHTSGPLRGGGRWRGEGPGSGGRGGRPCSCGRCLGQMLERRPRQCVDRDDVSASSGMSHLARRSVAPAHARRRSPRCRRTWRARACGRGSQAPALLHCVLVCDLGAAASQVASAIPGF